MSVRPVQRGCKNPARYRGRGAWRTCVRLVPDVAVEDFSERVEDTDHDGQHAEEDDSSQRDDALQHRVHPHTRHVVHPTRPGPGGVKAFRVKIKPFLTRL